MASRYRYSTMTCEVKRRVGHHSFDDEGRRFNGIDKTSGFAKLDPCVIGITFHKGLPITWPLDGYVLFKQVLTPVPTVGESIATNSSGESTRPRDLPSDIRHSCAQRTVAIRFNDCIVVAFLHQCFFRRPQAGAN
jgi:hypothetical protein